MKTLCYEIRVTEYGYTRNDGFIIVELGNKGQLKQIEGILTLDYIQFEFDEDYVYIKYYIPDEQFNALIEDFEVAMRLEDLEIPLSMNIVTEEKAIYIVTKNKISDIHKIHDYKIRLKEFKELSVFKEMERV